MVRRMLRRLCLLLRASSLLGSAAKYLRESNEENTRLRDTFERMAQVTQSLST
jgi:hypothetical protein